MAQDCIFCKIVNKEIPADIVYEDDKFIAFNDIHPVASVHILIVPKRHIVSVSCIKSEDKDLMGELIMTAKKIAEEKNLKGYKLIINVNKEGGQVINHIHLHLLGGKLTKLP